MQDREATYGVDGAPGWRVVLGCFIGLSVAASPAFFSSYGVYLRAIALDTGWSRSALSIPIALAAFVAAFALPVTGIAIDRVGPRRVVLVACLGLPLAMAGFRFVDGYAAMLVLSVAMGLIVAPSSPLTYLSLLPQWFERRLGIAVSVAMCGIGLGAAVLPLVTGRAVLLFGWRDAWVAMAALVLIVGVASWLLLIRENSRHVGARRARSAATLNGMTLRDAVGTRDFWLLLAGFFLISVAVTGTTIHAVALLTDRGTSPETAVRFAALMGISTLAGRLITGAMLDRLPTMIAGLVFFGILTAGLILLIADVGVAADGVAVAMIGAGFGAEGDIMPYTVRRKYGMKAFGRIFGVCFAAFQFGPVFGPLMMGVSFDKLGSYQPALIASAGFAAIATLLIVAATRTMPAPDAAIAGHG